MPRTIDAEAWHRDGFLIVPDVFAPADLQPVRDEIAALVDDCARRLLARGRIHDACADLPFSRRLTAIERQWPGAAVLVHKHGVLGPQLARLWSSPALLDLVEQLIGPEIVGHPVWNIRTKTPLNPLTTVPWHQDTAYLAAGSERTLQPTAWIPLVDADAVNGTLQVVRGGHRPPRVLRHHLESERGDRRSWYLAIDERDLPPGERVTCTMPVGSVLFINQLIPHRSTENLSDGIRWSIDLRWQRPGEPSGFEGVKECIPMRTAADRARPIDWGGWAARDRVAAAMEAAAADELSSDVGGPWQDRWRAG